MPRKLLRYIQTVPLLLLSGLTISGAATVALGADVKPDASCALICGEWERSPATGTTGTSILESALAKYREPDSPLNSGSYARCPEEPCATPGPDPEDDFLDPRSTRRSWRPTKAEMREELTPKVELATELTLVWNTSTLTVKWNGEQRRYQPGESYVRVDAWGAAEVECRWRGNRFIVREDYGRGRRNTDVYRFDPQQKMLYLERRLDRPGLGTVLLTQAYTRRQ